MQLSGNATVTNGSNIVDAAVGVDWSQASVASYFTRADSFGVYDLVAPPALIGGRWRVYLSANYSEVDEAAAPCVVHKDFGPDGEIIFALGDTEILPLLNRWCRAIAQRVSAGGGSTPPADDPSQLQTEAGENLQTEAGENIIAQE